MYVFRLGFLTLLFVLPCLCLLSLLQTCTNMHMNVSVYAVGVSVTAYVIGWSHCGYWLRSDIMGRPHTNAATAASLLLLLLRLYSYLS